MASKALHAAWRWSLYILWCWMDMQADESSGSLQERLRRAYNAAVVARHRQG